MAHKEVAELSARLDELKKHVADKQTKSNKEEAKKQVFGSPFARKGESAMSSRGFQFQRLIGAMTKRLEPEFAKIELDVCERLRNECVVKGSYEMDGQYLAPLGTELMGGAANPDFDEAFRAEIKSLTDYGVAGADPDEMTWVANRSYAKANQSWVDETLGGALVAPPAFGELIQLLRNKSALINAGASVVPLPPQGRIKYPRQTTPTSFYNVGENAAITGSNFNTGSLVLSAKKIGVLVTMPNELIRFASPASEALLRADMAKTLDLGMDYNGLYGEGSDTQPLGLINTPNIATVTPTTTGGNGDTLSPQDLYAFVSAIEENNAECEAFIMRPSLFFKFIQARAGVYNGSSTVAQGPFVYSVLRDLGQGMVKMFDGYKIITTPQVSITRSKGGASNLTSVFAGMFSDALLAMFGSIEFANANQGDTAFANDQTVVRAILSYDVGYRHPGAFAVADQLVQSVGA